MSFIINNSPKFSLGKQILKGCSLWSHQLQLQGLKTTGAILSSHKHDPETTQQIDSPNAAKKEKRKETLMITLLQNENMTVTALEAAKNLAKRRSLHLVKIQDVDTKTQRPVFKLLTSAEMLQNELSEVSDAKKNAAAQKKPEKTLNINARIAEHDLNSRLKNISKWLNKQHEVRILIQASSERDLQSCEKIFKTIEELIKTPEVNGKIVQKRSKGNAVHFSILPVTPVTNDQSAAKSQ